MAAKLRDNHLALVVPHLFGVPTDFRPVLDSARRRGILVVEDCAHTFGGKIGNRIAGTIGDASIFSFGHDKPISLCGGGLLLINRNDIQPLFQPMASAPSVEQEMMEFRDRAAWLANRRWNIRRATPISRLRRQLSGQKFRGNPQLASGIGPLRATLGIWQLDQYEKILAVRNRNAALMSDIKHWRSWHIDHDVSPAWLKQKVIPEAPVNIKALCKRFRKYGLSIGPINWAYTMDSAVNMPEGVNAAYVAKYGLDVPIHQNMGRKDMRVISDTLLAAH
jgi:dTDP-4-amino-4,6-dideoxygalactose transaminase